MPLKCTVGQNEEKNLVWQSFAASQKSLKEHGITGILASMQTLRALHILSTNPLNNKVAGQNV